MTIDVVTVHFGRSGWTRKLVEAVCAQRPHPSLAIRSILVVDNSRDGWIASTLRDFDRVSVRTFPVDQSQMDRWGHDHAASLSQAVTMSDADILLVFDCDAHPLNDSLLDYVHQKLIDENYSAIAAPDPRFPDLRLTHPCFLALTREARREPLPFDSANIGIPDDVGRYLLHFLEKRGLRVHMPERRRAFGGVWGEILDEVVYHHGSATFRYSPSVRLLDQVHPYSRIFEKCVLAHGRYELSVWERAYLAVHSRFSRYLQAGMSVLRRPLPNDTQG